MTKKDKNMPKSYLLTGATSGIGLAIYKSLHEQGHHITVVLRDKRRAEVLPYSPQNIIEADFANPLQVDKSFKGFDTPLDGIINAAGILQGNSIFESTPETLSELFNINVISPILMIKHTSSQLSKGGAVILFGSISGHKGSYDDAYAASKGAIHSLVRSLSLKLAPNARVVGIAPGMTLNTGMTNSLIEGRLEHNIKLIPMQLAGDPGDIASLTNYILSDEAQFMTGNVIDINGGQYLRS
tara:strand:- start:116746 stop:117468 length:723 start_codon:yes stop_codon:yes gene_type:complete